MLAEKVGSDIDLKEKFALKALLVDQYSDYEDLNEELLSLDNNEVALLSRQLRRVIQSKAKRYEIRISQNSQGKQFNKLITQKNYHKGNNNNNYTQNYHKNVTTVKNQEVCFECKQPGHYKRECPKIVNNKVLVADGNWDLSDDDEAQD